MIFLSWSLVALGATGSALAQSASTTAGLPAPAALEPSANTVESLTVLGRRSHETPLTKARDFVQAHGGPTSVIGQLARWHGPICPVTVGLSAAMNAFVSARLGARAVEVGAPTAKGAECKPNIDIIFTDEPRRIVDRVAQKGSAFLGFHYVAQTRAFTTVSRPIQAWYLTGTRNSSGQHALDVASGATANEDTSLGRAGSVLTALRDLAHSPEGNPDSRLTQKVSSYFANVIIVADAHALSGREIGPVADYIALLALSQSRSLDGCDALPSILDLLSPRCGERAAPDSLTDSDLAYLEALYSINLEARLTLEKDQIADRMARRHKAARNDSAQ